MTIPVGFGARLIIVSKEVTSYREIEILRGRMPSAEDFETYVVWDVVRPLDMAFISLRHHLERQGINCNGQPKIGEQNDRVGVSSEPD